MSQLETLAEALRGWRVVNDKGGPAIELPRVLGRLIDAGLVEPEDDGSWVQVKRDGIDFDIECGGCGETRRNVASTYIEARAVADRHELECPELEGRIGGEWS